MKKIGVFGGSFNPIHNGHIHLIEKCKEVCDFDKVMVIPSAMPVHKDGAQMISGAQRLNMCKLALQKYSWCTVLDMELTRKEKSFTQITMQTLIQQYPQDAFYLIIGSDMLITFHQWYRYRDILSSAIICAMRRDDVSDDDLNATKRRLETDGGTILLIDAPPLMVSSSEIRDRIKCGDSVENLVPAAVLSYIMEKGLYQK